MQQDKFEQAANWMTKNQEPANNAIPIKPTIDESQYTIINNGIKTNDSSFHVQSC